MLAEHLHLGVFRLLQGDKVSFHFTHDLHCQQDQITFNEIHRLYTKHSKASAFMWLVVYCWHLNEKIEFIWRCHHEYWKNWKLTPYLDASVRWAGRSLSYVTPAVTQGLGFKGLKPKTPPITFVFTIGKGSRWEFNMDSRIIFIKLSSESR